ncbi:MAG: DEAD/DEAH box helicase [Pirellulales bacterium]
MSLSQRCGGSFSTLVKLRGRQYYDERKLAVYRQTANHVIMRVQSNVSEEKQVTLVWDAGRGVLDAHCTCLEPGTSRHCKHLWAALLEVDRLRLMSDVEPRGPLKLAVSLEELALTQHAPAAVRADTAPVQSAPLQPAPVTAASPSRTTASTSRVSATAAGATARGTAVDTTRSGPAAWKTRLQHAFHGLQVERNRQAEARSQPDTSSLRQLWYILDLEQSTAERRPVIAYFQRYRSAPDRPWGPYQSIALDRESLHRWGDPQDRELLELLIGDDTDVVKSGLDSEIPSSRWFVSRKYGAAIPRLTYSLLLPKLCATERLIAVVSAKRPEAFLSAYRLTWDGDEPYELEFRMQEDRAKRGWEVRSELVRGSERIPLTRVQSVDRGELALINDRLVRMQRNAATQWFTWLGNEVLHVPRVDGPAFLAELLRFPEPPPIQLPAELRWPQVELPPRAVLKIAPDTPARARKQQLRLSPTFVYNSVELSPPATDSAIVDASERRIIKRDRKRERQLIEDLVIREGLQRLVRDLPAELPDYWCEPKQLEAVTQCALRAGWHVLAEGKLVRSCTGTRWNVTSEMDWFELDGQLEFDGQQVSFPAILKAVRQGLSYVELGDGSRGMLPSEWLSRFGLLADLAHRDDETLRFLPSQALLLDALLADAAADAEGIDERFASWRAKLAEFRGFAAHPAPPGFGGQLRPYQELGLGWLHGLRDLQLGGCLADDMGLGKTVQVLALLETRRQQQRLHPAERAPSLVVAPKSLVFNWADEARRFTPEMRVLNFTGAERESLRDRLHEFDLVLTTYGTLRRDVADLREIQFDYAILDEAQAIKNAASLSAKSCRLLRARHRLAMTGTPIENHLGELWSLFEFINPGMLGASAAFQRLVKASRSEPSREEAAGDGARQTLAQSLRPFILRRTKKQVLTELPERSEQTLYCEMEAPQRQLYDQLRSYYRQQLLQQVDAAGLAQSKFHVLEALLRLRQVACHPALVDPQHAALGSAKLDTLLDQLNELVEEGHKALIFSQFTSLLGLVRERLDADKIRYEYLDGSTANRGECVERFQTNPAIPLFLISLRAGGQGLNLTAADYVFILDPWWNPAVEAQAVDRAYRLGQTRHVFAYRLICRDTIEDRILEMQSQKRALADAILTEDNSILRDLTPEDLDRLLS